MKFKWSFSETFQSRIYPVLFIGIVLFSLLTQKISKEQGFDTRSDEYLSKEDLAGEYNQFRFWMGDRVFTSVLIGDDGWFFYTGDMSIRDYQKIDPLNRRNLMTIMNQMNLLRETTESYGGEFLLVVAPNKSTIYPEYMPKEIQVLGDISSLDRMIGYFDEKNSGINVLDLRPALMSAAKESQVYYKMDTHWNCNGAYVAYTEIISRINTPDKNLGVFLKDDFEIVSTEKYVGDLSTILGLSQSESSFRFVPKFNFGATEIVDNSNILDGLPVKIIDNSNDQELTVLVFSDSFYRACLDEFIEPAFGKTMSLSYNEAEMKDYLYLIETEQPDVVIFEFVERFMDYINWHFAE